MKLLAVAACLVTIGIVSSACSATMAKQGRSSSISNGIAPKSSTAGRITITGFLLRDQNVYFVTHGSPQSSGSGEGDHAPFWCLSRNDRYFWSVDANLARGWKHTVGRKREWHTLEGQRFVISGILEPSVPGPPEDDFLVSGIDPNQLVRGASGNLKHVRVLKMFEDRCEWASP